MSKLFVNLNKGGKTKMMRADIGMDSLLISQERNSDGEWLCKMNAAIERRQFKEGETIVTIVGVTINGVFTSIRDITF